jgi:sec-independent protein translocase protein TatC
MKRYDDEDFFADTRMSFGDHLEELRTHLLRAFYGFLVGLAVSFFFGQYVVAFIASPVEAALMRYYKERGEAFLKATKQNAGSLPPELVAPKDMNVAIAPQDLFQALKKVLPGVMKDAEEPAADAPLIQIPMKMEDPAQFAHDMQAIFWKFGREPKLTTLSATEAFMVYFTVCIITGLVLASPWVFYQIWSFVASGLYPQEKKYVNYYLPFSLSLFLGGVVVSEFLIIPNALDALLLFNKWMQLEPDFRLSEWLSFAVWVPVLAGISFQTPLVMLFLAKIGVFEAHQYVSGWRYAAFGMLIAAALGPTVDPYSLAFLWACMFALYGLGIVLTKWLVKPYSEVEESEETWMGDTSSVSQNGQQTENQD